MNQHSWIWTEYGDSNAKCYCEKCKVVIYEQKHWAVFSISNFCSEEPGIAFEAGEELIPSSKLSFVRKNNIPELKDLLIPED